MRKASSLLIAMALVTAAGCAAFDDSVDISAGREALILGNDAKALMEFQAATEFPENVWTYVGRSYHGLGDIAKAREAFERSVKLHPKAKRLLWSILSVLARRSKSDATRGQAPPAALADTA